MIEKIMFKSIVFEIGYHIILINKFIKNKRINLIVCILKTTIKKMYKNLKNNV